MSKGNIFYDIDGRHSATSYGGIGNIHELANLKKTAAQISAWQPLNRHAKASIKTSPRYKPDNVKEEAVRKRPRS